MENKYSTSLRKFADEIGIKQWRQLRSGLRDARLALEALGENPDEHIERKWVYESEEERYVDIFLTPLAAFLFMLGRRQSSTRDKLLLKYGKELKQHV